MKKLAFLLALVMLVSVFAACSDDPDPKDTTDAPGTETDTKEPETTDTKEPETTDTKEPETTTPLPTQGEVPCDFDNALDLSADISVEDFMLLDGGGQWVLGNDDAQMTTPITTDLLKEYKYIAIKYECDYSEETFSIAPMFKFVHEDGTKTEVLCSMWFQFGPADATYQASSITTMGVYCPTGVFYVSTELLMNHEAFIEGDVINQFGIASVEETGTVPYFVITGAYLTK